MTQATDTARAEALSRVLEEAGVRPSGGKICCPHHDDHSPSCQVYPDGHYYCFSCGTWGDAVTAMVAYGQAADTREALQRLGWSTWQPRQTKAPRARPETPASPPQTPPPPPSPLSPGLPDWLQRLSPEERARVRRAGQIWRAASNIDVRLPPWYGAKVDPKDRLVVDGAEDRGITPMLRTIRGRDLVAIDGVSLEGVGSPSDTLIIAKARVPGVCQSCAVQVIGPEGKRTHGVLRVDDGSEVRRPGVVVIGDLARAARIIICEGVGDAVALRLSDFAFHPNTAIVAGLSSTTMGTVRDGRPVAGSMTQLILDTEARMPRRDWVLCPDGDTAGRAWSEALGKYMLGLKLRCRIRHSPDGSDPADVAIGKVSTPSPVPLPSWAASATVVSRTPPRPGWQLPWGFWLPDGRQCNVSVPTDGVILLIGRPSSGKTAVLVSMMVARLIAQTDTIPWAPDYALIYSEDESVRTMAEHAIRHARGDPAILDRVALSLHDGLSATTASALAQDLSIDTGVCAVGWDYLQQFRHSDQSRGDRRDLDLADVVQEMRRLAHITATPQLVAVQVSRDVARSEVVRRGIETATNMRDLVIATAPRRPGPHHALHGGSEFGADVILSIDCIGGHLQGYDLANKGLHRYAPYTFVVEVVKDRFSHSRGALTTLFRSVDKTLREEAGSNPYADPRRRADAMRDWHTDDQHGAGGGVSAPAPRRGGGRRPGSPTNIPGDPGTMNREDEL